MTELSALITIFPKILWHSLLAIFLFTVLWICGIGALRLLRIPPTKGKQHRWLFVFPAGSVSIYWSIYFSLHKFPVNIVGWGMLLSIFCIGIVHIHRRLCWTGWQLRGWKSWAPLAAAIVLSHTLFLIGPTETTAGIFLPDAGYFAHDSIIYAESGAVAADLTLEGRTRGLIWRTYLPVVLGAAMLNVPGFDLYYFFATSIPLVYILTFVVIASLIAEKSRTSAQHKIPIPLIFGFLWTIAMVPGPGIHPGGSTWMVSSPQMILSLPLAFTLAAIALESQMTPREYFLVGIISIASLLPGKIVGLSVVMPIVFLSLFFMLFSTLLSKTKKWLLLFSLILLTVFSSIFLYQLIKNGLTLFPGYFFPGHLFVKLFDLMSVKPFPDPFNYARFLFYVLHLVGVALLLLNLLLSKRYLILSGATTGVLLSVMYPTLMAFSGSLALATIAVSIMHEDNISDKSIKLFWISGMFMAPSTMLGVMTADLNPDFLVPLFALLLLHLTVLRSATNNYRNESN